MKLFNKSIEDGNNENKPLKEKISKLEKINQDKLKENSQIYDEFNVKEKVLKLKNDEIKEINKRLNEVTKDNQKLRFSDNEVKSELETSKNRVELLKKENGDLKMLLLEADNNLKDNFSKMKE